MLKEVLLSSVVLVALSMSAYAGGDFKKLEEKEAIIAKQVKIEKSNKSNVVVRELKNGQPVDTVYSKTKVEYADVKTIERLKRAVVILIEKVEKFEKKVDAKEVSQNDLRMMQKDLRNDLNQKFQKELNRLSIALADNTNTIKWLKKEKKSNVKKLAPKSSKYDKKIEEFLSKENSLK
jgi:hypothetical protein